MSESTLNTRRVAITYTYVILMDSHARGDVWYIAERRAEKYNQ